MRIKRENPGSLRGFLILRLTDYIFFTLNLAVTERH